MGSTALAQQFSLPQPQLLDLQSPPPIEPETPRGDVSELTGLTHDASNLVTALRLCAELLREPGVLRPEHQLYASQITAMADASAALVGKLAGLARAGRTAPSVDMPVTDLAETLQQLGGLLTAVAGPKIVVQTACLPCAGSLRLSVESLTRIMLNLVRNAADAMPEGGRIRITAQRAGGASFFWMMPGGLSGSAPERVQLSVEDTGPGIRPELLQRIFEPGFSTRRSLTPWPEAQHQGLGLSIARHLVEEAGGTIRALSPGRRGARIEIELPVTLTNVTPTLLSDGTACVKRGQP